MAVLAEVVRLGGLCRGQAAMHGDPPDPGWIRQILGDPPSRVFFYIPANVKPDEIVRVESSFPDGVIVVFTQDGNGRRYGDIMRDTNSHGSIVVQLRAFLDGRPGR
jgi:hypothetical protein